MEEVNFKIGYLFFNELWDKLPNEFSYRLDDNIIFSNIIIDVQDEIWKEWLGLKWADVKNSNAMIKFEISTKTPEVLDDENKLISELIGKIYFALQLVGDFKIQTTHFFTGSRIGQEIKFRQWTEYDNWYSTDSFRRIEEKDMELWGKIFKGICHFHSRLPKDFLRFNRGLMCFQKGCREEFLDFRLPYFVSSLEALALPEKSKTKIQFEKRIAKWFPKCLKGNPEEILGEIYDLRSDCEHLHGIKEKYSKNSVLRACQCEEIARNAYQAILSDCTELESFTTDDKIKDYWNRCLIK